MSIERKIFIAFTIWWLGAVFTYGHAEKQFSAETRIKCEDDKRVRPCIDMVRTDAFLASMFWPLHWSEALWKMD